MTFKFLTVIFFCCLAFTYVWAENEDEKTKSPEAPDHEHSENCGHPLDKIKDGLVKIKNKISQTVTNAKNAVVEKYKNIKASIDKKRNGTATTESYEGRNEPTPPRDSFPSYVPTQIPLGDPESDMPLQPIPEQPDTGFSSGVLPTSNFNPELHGGSVASEANSATAGSVNTDEAAVNQDPSLIDLPQNPESETPAIDIRFGQSTRPARIQGRRN